MMTWREWKEKIEKLGVKDEDEIMWIDVQDDDIKGSKVIGKDLIAYWEIY